MLTTISKTEIHNENPSYCKHIVNMQFKNMKIKEIQKQSDVLVMKICKQHMIKPLKHITYSQKKITAFNRFNSKTIDQWQTLFSVSLPDNSLSHEKLLLTAYL